MPRENAKWELAESKNSATEKWMAFSKYLLKSYYKKF